MWKTNEEKNRRRTQGVKKLSFGSSAVDIKGMGPRNHHHRRRRRFESSQVTRIPGSKCTKNKIAANFDHLFILVTRGVIPYRCWFSGRFTPIETRTTTMRKKTGTQEKGL